MCRTPSIDMPDPPKPQYMHNPYFDGARSAESGVMANRTGRSALRIPMDSGLKIGHAGRNVSSSTSATAGARGNARPRGASGLQVGG